MTNLQEVPTDELLSFHDYPVVHQNINAGTNAEQAQINVTLNDNTFNDNITSDDPLERDVSGPQYKATSIWSLDFYQRFFDVDTKDVTDRILASMIPKSKNSLRRHITDKPDLYGPFWISVTLVFTIAVSGNISNYFQHVNKEYHWRYDFKLVSYAATAIWIYVIIVPLSLWAFIRWTSDLQSFNEDERLKSPGPLELICIYGYSLFIYIPVSILWSIQSGSLQWALALVSACLSGSVLLLTLLPSLRESRHKFFLMFSIVSCHLLLAAGFMLYFFHTHDIPVIEHDIKKLNISAVSNITNATTSSNVIQI